MATKPILKNDKIIFDNLIRALFFNSLFSGFSENDIRLAFYIFFMEKKMFDLSYCYFDKPSPEGKTEREFKKEFSTYRKLTESYIKNKIPIKEKIITLVMKSGGLSKIHFKKFRPNSIQKNNTQAYMSEIDPHDMVFYTIVFPIEETRSSNDRMKDDSRDLIIRLHVREVTEEEKESKKLYFNRVIERQFNKETRYYSIIIELVSMNQYT